MSKLTATSLKLIMIWTFFLSCFFALPVQGELAFRTTFNDITHIGTLEEYESQGSLGDGAYVYIRALSTDLATVAGQGPVENKAIQFDESGDELQIRRWVAPTDQFGAADLTQVASGMSFGYWLMADTTSNSPMSLLTTRSGDMPAGNINITHGLRHNGGSAPYTSRRAAMEIWTSAQPATEFTAGQWHHLVLTYSAGAAGFVTKKIYIDGSLASTPTTSGSVDLNPSAAHRIGGYWNGSTYTESFYGKLDQFDVWDTDLSDAEVLAEYNAGPANPPTPPTGDPNVGSPWMRFTFNDDDTENNYIHNEGSSEYYGIPHRDDNVNSLTYFDSPGGKAVSLVGSLNDFIQLKKDGVSGDASVLPTDLPDGGMSVAYWVRFNEHSIAYMSLLTTGGNGSSEQRVHHTLRYPASGDPNFLKRRFQFPYTNPPGSQTLINKDQWYHLAWTLEGVYDPNTPSQTTRFYVDGQLRHTSSNQAVRIGTGTNSRLGITFRGGNYVEQLTGDLDQFEIYAHKLSDANIASLYNSGPEQIIDPQLYLRFTFNEYQPAVDPASSLVANTGVNGTSYYGKTYSNGIENTNATYIASPGNTAIHINGQNKEYITFTTDTPPGNKLPTDIINDGMSIAYWVRYDITSEAYMSLLTTGSNSQSTANHLHHSIMYPIGSGSSYQERRFVNPWLVPAPGQTLVYADQWYHLVWTINGSPALGNQTQKFYLNGELVYFNKQVVYIGDTRDSRFGILNRSGFKEAFTGDLDQLDIYDNDLISSQVAQLYAQGPVRTDPQTCAQAQMQGYAVDVDFDNDCHVNIFDFANFNLQWLRCINPKDLNCEKPWNP